MIDTAAIAIAPFWRKAPLSPPETRLLASVLAAHSASAWRANASSTAAQTAAAGSGDFSKALIAALATLGWRHAPLEDCCAFLDQPDPAGAVQDWLASGRLVPGWGNAFEKGHHDPLWLDVRTTLANDFAGALAKLDAVTAALHAAGLTIYPNPGGYTALAAGLLGLPAPVAAWLFVAGRFGGWSEIIAGQLAQKKVKV